MKEDKGRPIILIILLLIVAVGIGCYYYINHNNKDGKDEKVTQEVNTDSKNGYNYKLLSTKNDYVIKYKKYIIEYNAEKHLLYKISDIDGNVLFEGEQEYDDFILDINKNIYIYTDNEDGTNNAIVLYKLEDKEFEKVKELYKKDYYIDLVVYEEENSEEDILYYDDFDYYLLGFEAINTANDNDDSIYYPLNGEEVELKGIGFKGDEVRLSIDQYVVTNNKDYITYYKVDKNRKNDLQGIYSLKDKKVLINATYDGIHSSMKNTYVVEKNNKAGIIDINEKKLVDFEYDFIDDNGDYYVVSKNGKMAIMDKNYKVISDYFIKYPGGDYIYELCCSNRNSFALEKFGDKYLYFVDNDYLNETQSDDEEKESKNEVYIVNSDYTMKKTSARDYYIGDDGKTIFLRSEKDNKVYVYDNKLNLKFEIDLNKYNVKENDVYFTIFGNTIYDIDNELYFDLKTGKELEDKKVVAEFNNVRIEFEKEQVDIIIDNKNVHSIKTEYLLPLVKFDKGFYLYYQDESSNDEIALFTKK